jgi:hypothetical protein
MKKLGIALFTILAMSMMLGTALAQNVGDNSVYFVTYFSNNVSAAPDATVRIINDGDSGGTLWADFYVFNSSQELTECCACAITADGILSEDVKTELTANPITGVVPKVGLFKVIASASDDPTNVTPTTGLRGTATHVQAATKSSYTITETALADSNLTSAEQSTLQSLCYYDAQLSGQPCTCTAEGQDF